MARSQKPRPAGSSPSLGSRHDRADAAKVKPGVRRSTGSLRAVVSCYGTLGIVALLSVMGGSVHLNEAVMARILTVVWPSPCSGCCIPAGCTEIYDLSCSARPPRRCCFGCFTARIRARWRLWGSQACLPPLAAVS